MDAFQILVLILGITLAVGLLLTIVALIYLIKILQHVKNITQKAENVADFAETAGRTFMSSTSPVAVAKLLIGIMKKSFRKKGGK
jgi:uncharacterized membrane protein